MAEQEEQTTEQSLQAVVHDNPNQPTFYANMCGVQFGPDEVMLQFAQRNPERLNEGLAVAKIYTSFSHVKRLALILLQSIHDYERNFGEILVDPMQRLTPEGKKMSEDVSAKQ